MVTAHQILREHAEEIYEVARGKLTSEWLDSFAEPKVRFEQSILCESWTERERPERLRLEPQLRDLSQRWLAEHPEFDTLQYGIMSS